ncbi:hypothetical protein C1N74_16030 (plasmid) [Microbacterium sp. SGAir0570]|uniref:hypothetical protein n=1 Tax=Microbacterium sp. SGAir0570 TaxID=2070348 RepID=UPI0010CCDFAD|nr:hypothetical protein [Microbacterium sp. SGAir0570]QCR42101.1 hypothetical protein C1N74_16030 [Microbacterium sp. SGAir0570]
MAAELAGEGQSTAVLADHEVPVLVGLGTVAEERFELIVNAAVVDAGAGDCPVPWVAVDPQRDCATIACGLEGVDVPVGGDLQCAVGADLVGVVGDGDKFVAEEDDLASVGDDLVGEEHGARLDRAGGHGHQPDVQGAGEAEGGAHAAALPSSVRSSRT